MNIFKIIWMKLFRKKKKCNALSYSDANFELMMNHEAFMRTANAKFQTPGKNDAKLSNPS